MNRNGKIARRPFGKGQGSCHGKNVEDISVWSPDLGCWFVVLMEGNLLNPSLYRTCKKIGVFQHQSRQAPWKRRMTRQNLRRLGALRRRRLFPGLRNEGHAGRFAVRPGNSHLFLARRTFDLTARQLFVAAEALPAMRTVKFEFVHNDTFWNCYGTDNP